MLIKLNGSIYSIKIDSKWKLQKIFQLLFCWKKNTFLDLLKVTEGIFGNKFDNMLISIINLK